MVIPWSQDHGPLHRRPWMTLALLAACMVALVVSEQDPGARQFGRALEEAHAYWSVHPYLEPGPLLVEHYGDAGAEAREQFQASLAAGEMPIPVAVVATEQRRLDDLVTNVAEALERHVWSRYGLVPSAPRLAGVFGHLFLHAGWPHLIGNLIFLLMTGPFLEDRWGRVPYLLFYLGAGLAAALVFAIRQPYLTSPLIGASGAIAGTMGAFLVLFGRVRVRFAYWLGLFWGTFAVPAGLLLPLWFLHELGTARLMDAAGASDGVAYWAHVGGFGFGLVVAGLFRVTGLDAHLAPPSQAAERPPLRAPQPPPLRDRRAARSAVRAEAEALAARVAPARAAASEAFAERFDPAARELEAKAETESGVGEPSELELDTPGGHAVTGDAALFDAGALELGDD